VSELLVKIVSEMFVTVNRYHWATKAIAKQKGYYYRKMKQKCPVNLKFRFENSFIMLGQAPGKYPEMTPQPQQAPDS